MYKRIIITESQYKRILLSEQIKTRKEAEDFLKSQGHTDADGLGVLEDDFIIAWANAKKEGEKSEFTIDNKIYDTKTGKFFKSAFYEMPKYIEHSSNNYDYDPEGGIGAGRKYLPKTGNLKSDNIAQLKRLNSCSPKKHDSKCNDRKKQKCIAQGGIPTNRTLKGKEWDFKEDLGKWVTKNGKRVYQTYMYGYDDNKFYTKCYCDTSNLGKVREVDQPCKMIGDDGEWKTVIITNTIYDKSWNQTYMSKSKTNYETIGMTDKEKQSYMEKQHALGARKERSFDSTFASDDFLYKYRHEILDVLSIAALAIPLAGPFISGAIELTNASMYYKEGDNFMGNLYVGLAFLPGGIQAFKTVKGAGIIKGVDKVTKEVAIMQKGGETVTKEVLENKLKKELGEKVFGRSEKILNDYYSVILKSESTASQKAIKEMTDLVSKTPAYYKEYLKSSQLVEKLIAKNGGSPYKAYLAFLRSVAGKESKIAALIYGGIVGGIKTYEVTTSEIRRANLETDAKKGNISSMVRLEGYDWNITREIFGSDKSGKDNELLKKAWQSGWRPYEGKYKKDINNPNLIPIAPDKEFWTQTFKDRIGFKDVELKDKVDDVVNDKSLSDDEKSEKIKELVPVPDEPTKIINGAEYIEVGIDNEEYLIPSDSINMFINVGDVDMTDIFGGGQ
jgi:hypothetical protein